MNQMVIDFPPQDDVRNENLKILIKDLETCLDTSINIETMTIIRCRYDGGKVELTSILQRLAGNKTRLNKMHPMKKASSKPFRISEMEMDKKIDPLGS